MGGGSGGIVPAFLVNLYESGSFVGVSILLLVGMLLAAIVGYRIRQFTSKKTSGEDRGQGQEAFVTSAVLGLLALLLGFTFSLALGQFEQRSKAVLAEANAIGATYLRADLLAEPERRNLRHILIDYTRNRIALAGPVDEKTSGLLVRNDRLLDDLWLEVSRSSKNSGITPVIALVVASANEVIALDAARKDARAGNVPSAVYAALTLFMIVAAGLMGYTLACFYSRLAAVFLFLLMCLSILLIMDIDHPNVGMLRESQTPMKELLAKLVTLQERDSADGRVGM